MKVNDEEEPSKTGSLANSVNDDLQGRNKLRQ